MFCCALIQARQMGVQADGSSIALEAWSMAHGNPLLHGWYLADVTFYTTELPEYMLVEVFRGLRPDVVTICAALTYTLVVLLAAAVAYGGGASRRGSIAGAVIAVAVLLGPVPAATGVLLTNPDHVGSAVPVLFAFLLAGRVLRGRPGPRRWLLSAAVAAVLGWSVVGDSLIALTGIVPIVVVCFARAGWRLAVQRQPVAAASAEVALGAAGVAAAIAGAALTRLIRGAGGYATTPLRHRHAVPLGVLPHNLRVLTGDFLTLFSASLSHARLDGWLAVTLVHLAFAGLVAGCVVVVLLRCFRGEDLVSWLLATAILANLAGYALLYQVAPVTTREIGPVFGLGGALAGRVAGERVLRLRAGWLVAVLAGAALAVLVPPLLTVVPGSPAAGNVAAFLASHHLRSGLAGYWQSNNITVETGGQVTVSPLIERPGVGLGPDPWELDSRYLNARGHQAHFVVVTPPGSQGGDSVTKREAISLFGNPAQVYRLSPGYQILVWRKNLLRDLPRPLPASSGPGPGWPLWPVSLTSARSLRPVAGHVSR